MSSDGVPETILEGRVVDGAGQQVGIGKIQTVNAGSNLVVAIPNCRTVGSGRVPDNQHLIFGELGRWGRGKNFAQAPQKQGGKEANGGIKRSEMGFKQFGKGFFPDTVIFPIP